MQTYIANHVMRPQILPSTASNSRSTNTEITPLTKHFQSPSPSAVDCRVTITFRCALSIGTSSTIIQAVSAEALDRVSVPISSGPARC